MMFRLKVPGSERHQFNKVLTKRKPIENTSLLAGKRKGAAPLLERFRGHNWAAKWR
jgi:hypothetical protein